MFRISNKLTITFGLLISSAIFVCGWSFYGQTKHHLDTELGHRLVDIAQTVAVHSNGNIIKQLIPGNEDGLTYRHFVSQLSQVKEKTGVSRIYIFDKHNRSLLDTHTSIPIGNEYLKLKFDQLELESVWQKKSIPSVLFLGEDGNYYKSGYAPILVGDEVVAAVGVDASAAFLHILKKSRRNVLTFALVCIFISLVIVFIMSKKITSPIHTLVTAIDKIGSGDLNTEIKISSNDEIGFLGKTMDQMRMNIIKRDAQMKLMLANVAHEIRNPLGGIELFAGILAEELGQEKNNLNDSNSNTHAQAHLEKITQEVRKLNQIITEFLDFARPKQPQKTKTSLKELIQSTYFMLALFHSEVEPLLKINVDPEQFKRVFVNLFKNSLQAIQNSKMKDGKVTVRSKRKEGIVEVIVKDNGPGIPQKQLPCLFEPFFTTKEKGAGLGLAIVQKIVTDHGENIEIHSTEGKSTTAIIRLSQP